MNSSTTILLLGLFNALLIIIWNIRTTRADENPQNIERDKQAEEKYAALCTGDERLLCVCRGYYKNEYYVLTDRNLIIEDHRKGQQVIPLDRIRKVKFKKINGKKAKHFSECQIIIVYTDRKYALTQISEKFAIISEYLFERYK